MASVTLIVTVPEDPDFPMTPTEVRDMVREELSITGARVDLPANPAD